MKLTINSIPDYEKALKKYQHLYCVDINQKEAIYFINEVDAVKYLQQNRISNVDSIIEIKEN